MSNTTKIILLAAAGLAAYYVPTLLAIYNMEMSIISVLPSSLTGSRLTALIMVKLKNNSGTIINLTQITADILLNGLKIAEFSQAQTLTLLEHSEQNFNVQFTVDAEVVGMELFRQLTASNLQNSIITIRGTITGNGKNIPFTMYRTLNDFKA